MGLFVVLMESSSPNIMKQYCKLRREQNKSTKEWMSHLRMKANECGYKEKERRVKEQLTNGIHDDDMMTEIIRELTTIEKTNDVTNEHVLA